MWEGVKGLYSGFDELPESVFSWSSRSDYQKTKNPFRVSSLIQLAGCLASLMILLVILATGFLFESLPQVHSWDLVWSVSMCRDFAISFVYIFVAISWVFTVTLAQWYEKGPRLGPRSHSTIYSPAPQSGTLGKPSWHLWIWASLSAKWGFGLTHLRGPFSLWSSMTLYFH